ncbi:MAG: FkbM family methyltransferase [Candidatus Acidiferrales bacterium]|jgi:FkbM family methyltransferase
MNFGVLSSETALGRIARLPLALVPREWVVPILQGPLRGKRWIAGSANHSCWLGFYEQNKQQILTEEVELGSVFYDVGANVGIYSLLCSLLVGNGKVYAFEPVPRNLAYLRKHLKLNHARNVEILPFAISDKIGQAQFEIEASGLMGRLTGEGSLTVATATLDSLVENGGMAPPDFIKMDIEGAELSALRGASFIFQRYRPVLFLATHGRDIERECRKLLELWDYEIEEIGMDSSDRKELLAKSRL